MAGVGRVEAFRVYVRERKNGIVWRSQDEGNNVHACIKQKTEKLGEK